ncbi:hypothetical protein BJV82DRAFT_230610 [Fennellomyces sp. T-0311]|nr:hypothetical protein BJV82DRAFT_230610 [Fennellomyces sp. T-0311]
MSTDGEEDMEDYYSKRSLARLRQNSEDNPRQSAGLENDMIARFSKESLYSYSFNPASLRTSRSARTSRKHMIQRGVDFVKRLRYKLDDRVTRRFSHPDIGGTMYTWQTSYWSVQNTPRTSIDYENGTNLMASLAAPEQQPDDVLSTSSSGSSSSSGRRQTLPRSSADQGVPTALPPIYESAHGSVSPNPRSDATEKYYKRALHAPTRFLPQNQAIFTTTVDGTILLFNDIASLCFGINKSYVGKPLLPVLQYPFRKHVEMMLLRRSKVRGKDSVLVCGNVVSFIYGCTAWNSVWDLAMV